MDKFDREILSHLQMNGRASFQEVGDAVGLSLSACHKRVKALEKAGVIERYAAIAVSYTHLTLPTICSV